MPDKNYSKRRAGFLAKGLCPVCYGKNLARDGSNICEECYQKRSNYDKERRKKFKEIGLCIRCAKAPAREGLTICGECTNKEEEERQQAIKVGLCSSCKIRPRDKTQQCKKCYDRGVKKNHRNQSSQLIRFNQAKRGALGDRYHKNHIWAITYEEYCELINKNAICAYCGDLPNGKLHGLDRVDNNIGYFLDNVVPCCKRCNFMKKELSTSEFLAHVNKIRKHALKND